jgi:hypothetical protein
VTVLSSSDPVRLFQNFATLAFAHMAGCWRDPTIVRSRRRAWTFSPTFACQKSMAAQQTWYWANSKSAGNHRNENEKNRETFRESDRYRHGWCPGNGRCVSGSWGGWQRLLRRPVSESGRLCHGDGAHGRGHRRRRAFMLPILWSCGDGREDARAPAPRAHNQAHRSHNQ